MLLKNQVIMVCFNSLSKPFSSYSVLPKPQARKLFMCYELVHWCLRLLSDTHVDRFGSEPPKASVESKKTRGGDDVIKTEKDNTRKRKAATAKAAIADDGDEGEDDEEDEGHSKKVNPKSINNLVCWR